MRCPFCGSTVEPTRNAAGQLVCPLCGNTGRIAPAPPGAQSWTASPSPSGAAGAPYPAYSSSSQWPPPADASASSAMGAPGRAPTKALLALIFGIAAFVLFPIAIILGPVALVLGIQALRKIKRMPPGTPGQGLAITGIVLGGIGIMVGITIVMAAIVFVLVSNLGTMGEWDFDVDASGVGGVLTVKDYPDAPAWSDFELGGTASCRLPTGDVQYGDEIVCTTDGSVILMDAATNQALYNATV